MTTAVRPGMYGRPRLPAAKIEERGLAMAQRLNPTLAEAEAARRAYARRPAGTPTVFQRAVATTLAGDGLPGPETGGSWADVALAEPIDD